jgi:hypothetical protein
MSAPTPVGTLATNTGSGTAVSATLPSSIAVGELILVLVSCGTSNTSISTPSGWTSIDEGAFSGTITYRLLGRIAEGDEGSSLAITMGTSRNWVTMAIRVQDGDLDTIELGASGGVNSFDPGSISLAGGSDDVLYLEFVGANGNDLNVNGQSTGYTPGNWTVKTGNSTGNAGAAFAYKSATASSGDDPDTMAWGNTGSARRANVIAIHFKVAVSYEATHYRFYDDDDVVGSETPLDDEDTDVSVGPETPFRLRYQIDTTGDAPSEGVTLQYKEVSDDAVEWRDVSE